MRNGVAQCWRVTGMLLVCHSCSKNHPTPLHPHAPSPTLLPLQYCTLSSGGDHPFWSNKEAPIAGTESQYTASGERR